MGFETGGALWLSEPATFSPEGHPLLSTTTRTLRYRSVHDLNQAIVRWSRSLGQDVDVIVGVPRSGLLVASLLGLHMHRPVMDLSSFLAGAEPWSGLRMEGTATRHANVLIVDDTVNSGTEMRRVREAIMAAGVGEGRNLKFAAVYASPEGQKEVDSYAEVLPVPRVFEWNILNHKLLLADACMDIDGVLCPDPAGRDNDDGPRYRKFLSDTELRYKPATKVGALVTSRLEMYRPETEAWLAKHGIQYDRLIMLDLPSAEERRRLMAHAPHKAKAYMECGSRLFIESEPDQAREIYKLTGKPVFATDTREFFGPGADLAFSDPWRDRAVDTLKSIPALRKLRDSLRK